MPAQSRTPHQIASSNESEFILPKGGPAPRHVIENIDRQLNLPARLSLGVKFQILDYALNHLSDHPCDNQLFGRITRLMGHEISRAVAYEAAEYLRSFEDEAGSDKPAPTATSAYARLIKDLVRHHEKARNRSTKAKALT